MSSTTEPRVKASTDARHFVPSWVLYEKAPAEPWLFRGVALQALYKLWHEERNAAALDVPPYASLASKSLDDLKPFLGIWTIGEGAEPAVDTVYLGEGPLAYLKIPDAKADAPLKDQTPEPNFADVRHRMMDVRDKRHANYCVKSMAYMASPFGRYEALYLPFANDAGDRVTHVVVAFSFVFGFDNTNWVFGGV
jgi:hypothetical protein